MIIDRAMDWTVVMVRAMDWTVVMARAMGWTVVMVMAMDWIVVNDSLSYLAQLRRTPLRPSVWFL